MDFLYIPLWSRKCIIFVWFTHWFVLTMRTLMKAHSNDVWQKNLNTIRTAFNTNHYIWIFKKKCDVVEYLCTKNKFDTSRCRCTGTQCFLCCEYRVSRPATQTWSIVLAEYTLKWSLHKSYFLFVWHSDSPIHKQTFTKIIYLFISFLFSG